MFQGPKNMGCYNWRDATFRGNTQGSHSYWKTWKNDNSFSSPRKVLEFYNFIKNPGKMGVNREK